MIDLTKFNKKTCVELWPDVKLEYKTHWLKKKTKQKSEQSCFGPFFKKKIDNSS
jgi:hypothetical protein